MKLADFRALSLALRLGVVSMVALPALAQTYYEADNATILELQSFDAQHFWVKLSAYSTCPTPNPWVLVRRWDDQSEPNKTQRQVIYQLVMMAFASGKSVRVVSTSCYNNQYLYADTMTVRQ